MKALATKFLDPYTKTDRDIFFGRDQEIETFTEKLQTSKLTLLYGLSGTGKTSLIECGVANEFSEYDWLDVYIRRKFNIIDSLREAIINRSSNIVKPTDSISRAIGSLSDDYFRPVYLVFDQLEELFISGDNNEINDFGDVLAEILNANVPCRIILVLREEYFGRLDHFEAKIPKIYDSRMRLERMNIHSLRDVLKLITNMSDVRVESDEVLSDILKAVTNDSGAIDLPDLAVYLKKIYDAADQRRRPGEDIIFDKALVAQNQFVDILGNYLNDTVQNIANEVADAFDKTSDPKEFVWEVLKKYFISLDGTKKTFSWNERS